MLAIISQMPSKYVYEALLCCTMVIWRSSILCMPGYSMMTEYHVL